MSGSQTGQARSTDEHRGRAGYHQGGGSVGGLPSGGFSSGGSSPFRVQPHLALVQGVLPPKEFRSNTGTGCNVKKYIAWILSNRNHYQPPCQ
ncbi:hypothetical protein DPEC_G00019590 [Dallia pectoralis]|uniref:Uncharacterized protein n=1 Tax=Dallia pectoralis TaxID=75939 RepID=A0ACC2HG18_DALPE|nr:hypothetical protein DPEC_G00019590 [Dallia pectoralis]